MEVSELRTGSDKLLSFHSVTMSAIENSIHCSVWPTGGVSKLIPYKNIDAIFNIIKDTFRINKEYSSN